MLELGVLVEKLDMDQKSLDIINSLNVATDNNELCPIVFFLEYGAQPKTCLFAKMQAEEVYCYSHPVIDTDIKTAELLIECPLPTKKFLYLWDMDWLYSPEKFGIYNKVFQSMDIITRCKSHSELVKQCWLKDNYIIEDFNYVELQRLF